MAQRPIKDSHLWLQVSTSGLDVVCVSVSEYLGTSFCLSLHISLVLIVCVCVLIVCGVCSYSVCVLIVCGVCSYSVCMCPYCV